MKLNYFYLSFLSIILMDLHIQGMSIATVINQPGEYAYGMDFFVQPQIANDAIIIITVSDVSLNLGNIILTQMNSVPGLQGVVVQPGLQNIIITGGNFSNLTGQAVVVNDGCNNFTLDSMHMDSCNGGGILLDGLTTGTGIFGAIINNCTIISSTGINGTPAYGIQLNSATDIHVTNCICNNNDAVTTSSGYGFIAQSCNNCEFVSCIAEYNGGNTQAAGIALFQSNNCKITYCNVFNNLTRDSSSTTTTFGIFLNQCTQTIVDYCESIKNINTNGGIAIGIGSSFGTSNLFTNCLSQGNVGSFFAAGFQLNTETSSYISDGTSRDNSATGSAYGIYLNGSNNNCYVQNSFVISNMGTINSFGINDALVPSTNLIIKNYAFNNGTNYNVNYGNGITLPIISASLSQNPPGLPAGASNAIDNISVNP